MLMNKDDDNDDDDMCNRLKKAQPRVCKVPWRLGISFSLQSSAHQAMPQLS